MPDATIDPSGCLAKLHSAGGLERGRLQGRPADGRRLGLLPFGQLLGQGRGLISLQVRLELRRGGRPVLLLLREPGGELLLVGGEGGLGGGDGGEAVALELGTLEGELQLALAERLGQLAVIVVDGLDVAPAGGDLLGGRRPVEDPQEELIDQLGDRRSRGWRAWSARWPGRRWRRRASGR